MSSVAVIGAGCSGLAAAHELRGAGYVVTIFEKSRDVGGRAATREQQGFIYDHGAQYIKGASPLSDDLITERFRLADLIDIGKPVWIFDGEGHIQEGDPIQNAQPKWNYRSGLNALAKSMAWEHEKAPERVPGHAGLLIAQMAPQYSRDHWDLPAETLISDVANCVATLLDEPLNKPVFTDMFHWRHALPAEKADARQLNAITLLTGLAFCGDAFVGGRVHLALEHGIEVARQLIKMGG